MRHISPLRYPGGKAGLAPTLGALFRSNGLNRPTLAEPYAGGAGASLELLFAQRIKSVPLSILEWHKQREVYRNARRHKRFDVGFATFYLNRTNRSGILVDGGPIGGIKQRGKWRLSARFNRAELIRRVERISAYRERISVSNLDALVFIHQLREKTGGDSLFFYLDPPYYEKGAELYLSNYAHSDHVAIGAALRSSNLSHWALTYDDVQAIRKIYANCKLRPFRLRYTASSFREGRELLIVPKSLLVPDSLPL